MSDASEEKRVMKMLRRTVGMLLCLAMLAGYCTAAFAAVDIFIKTKNPIDFNASMR